MKKYKHHKYTYAKPFDFEKHNWELVGPYGGVSFHASFSDDAQEASAGLEFHHTEACGYRPETAPDHINCYLTGGACWHDGTSLYASETLWPKILPLLRSGGHQNVFSILEYEADKHFSK